MDVDKVLLEISRLWEDCHNPDRSVLRTQVLTEGTTTLLHSRNVGVIADNYSITNYINSTSVSLTDSEIRLNSGRLTVNADSVSLPKDVYFGGYLLNPDMISSELLSPTDYFTAIQDTLPLVVGTPLVAIGQTNILLSELFETVPFLTEAMRQLSSPILNKYIKQLSNL